MIYSLSVDVAPSTARAYPISATVVIPPGVIRQFTIGFPPGCAGLVHAILLLNGAQILPSNLGTSIAWDSYVFVWPEATLNSSRTGRVSLQVWSEDDSYTHTIAATVVVTPDSDVGVRPAVDALRRFFGLEGSY